MATTTVLHFTLEIGSLHKEEFRVLEFTMTEALSECFTLNIKASCGSGKFAHADLIGKDATLTVAGEDFPVSHHGVVTEFNQYPDSSESFGHESYLYDIVIEPHCKLLAYTTQNRIFQKMDVKAIVEKVLADGGLTAGAHFKFGAQGPFLEREYTVQYNETDLNFVQRLLEDEGIFYFFDHEGKKDLMVMTDKLTDVKPIPNTPMVDFMGQAGLSHLSRDHVSKMRRTQRMVTGKVTLKDYNDRTPDVKILGKNAKTGQGELYQYGPHASTTAEADRLAALRAEMLACNKVILDGEGICRSFRAGYRFMLVEPGPAQFAGKYTLTRVTHHGDQREGFEGEDAKIIYTNTFACMPADVVFRPAQATPRPKVHGVLIAKVDGQEGPYAYLDEDGRYHAKLPFDLTALKDGQASLPIRMSQPYGGPNYGMHFPVHNGNDIVLSFFDGNIDRPIALGTLPNPSMNSPVTGSNKSESVIRTASGHQLRLDDKEGETIIDINTAGKHLLALNDNPSSKQIQLKTSGGHTLVFDDTGKKFSIATTGGHTLTIDDAANSITVQTKGGHAILMDDPGKKISIKDGQGVNAIELDGGGSLLHLSTTGDLKMEVGKSMTLTVQETLTIAAKNTNLDNGETFTATSGQATNVTATADLGLAGKNTTVTAEIKLSANGKMVESTGEVSNKLAGAMIDINASGVATMAGATIKLN